MVMGVCLPIAPELKLFYEKLLSQEGFPYVWPTAENRWSGKGFPTSLYPEGRDCSGTITWALWAAGLQPDMRSTMNSGAMWARWDPAVDPLPGDFVLYYNNPPAGAPKRIVHVMTLMEDGRVFGADGAGSNCTNPDTAKQLNAKVQWRTGPHYYRTGILAGFRRNPLRRK